MEKRAAYQSDLSEVEWEIARRHIPGKGKLGRPPRYEKREILNAILYISKEGCTWRDMPHDLPPWRLVYYYFEKWQAEGIWERINDALREKVREKSGKKKSPRLRSSTARALRWLGSAESVVTMRAKRSWEERDIFSWTPLE
jgi:transposase